MSDKDIKKTAASKHVDAASKAVTPEPKKAAEKPTFTMIPVGKIIVTGRNHRVKIDEVALEELKTSIKEVGVLNPLTVRPSNEYPNCFELAAGERRLKASIMAGLDHVPCHVKNLSDEAFNTVMLMENIQREELNPLDEAKAYEDLLKNKNSVIHIAAQSGKSLKHVKQRLALNKLVPAAKQEFLQGVLLLGHAQILALFPAKDQNEALASLARQDKETRYFNSPVELKRYLNRSVLMSLADAPFDITNAKLVPKAGACINCPKQTNADNDLFSGLSSESKCMDRQCYLKKRQKAQDIKNQKLLDEFKMKKSDCVGLTNLWYNQDDLLGSDHYTIVDAKDSCLSVTLGLLHDGYDNDSLPEVVMVCMDKKCKVHRSTSSRKVSEIPPDETIVEGVQRKSKKRRNKEDVADIHAAREEFIQVVGAVESKTPNPFELEYIAKKLLSHANEKDVSKVAFDMGFLKEEDHTIDWHNRSEFFAFLTDKGETGLTTFMRRLILVENQQKEDKEINQMKPERNVLLNHGQSLNQSMDGILKKYQDQRIEPRAEEDEAIKALIKKDREKKKKIQTLFKNAKTENPLLHRLKNASKETIVKEEITELSKLAFQLGLKRKKDGTAHYYSEVIYKGILDLKEATKPKASVSAAKKKKVET